MANLPLAVQVLVGRDAVVLGSVADVTPETVAALAPGSTLVIVESSVRGALRLRRGATRRGLRVERVFVVLPSLVQPLCCVELDSRCLSWVWAALATVPPGRSVSAPLAELVLRWGNRATILGLLARLAPARVAIARRL